MKHALSIAAAALAFGSSASAQNSVFAVNFAGNFYRVANSTGTGALVGPTGFTRLNSLASFQGRLLTVTDTGQLVEVNRFTGVGQLVDILNFGGKTDVRALAFDTAEVGYAVVDGGGSNSDELWRLVIGQQPTFVGSLGRSSVQGLAVINTDEMFCWDTDTGNAGGLRRVNRLTGATTDVNASLGADNNIQDLYPFGSNLRGGRDATFILNETTGTSTLVGSGGYTDLRGLALGDFRRALSGFTVSLGQQTAGNQTSLANRDGDVLAVRKFFVPNQGVDPIDIEFRCDLPQHLTLTQILNAGFSFAGRMDTTGSFRLSFDFFNTTTDAWENVATTTITTEERQFAFTRTADTAIARFTGRSRYRVRVKPNGPVANPNFSLLTDLGAGIYVMKD